MIRQADCVELALATLIADLKGASASVLDLPSFGAEPRSFGGAEKVTEARFYVVVLWEAVLKSLKHGYPSPRRCSVVRVMVLWTISRGFNSEIGRPWPTSQFLLCVCLCVLCAEFSCVSAGTNWRSRQYCWAARQLMLTEMTQLLVAGQRAMQPRIEIQRDHPCPDQTSHPGNPLNLLAEACPRSSDGLVESLK